MSRLQILLFSAFIGYASHAAHGGERIDLAPGNESGKLTHVSIQLEAGGNNLVRSQQQQSQPQQMEKADAAEQKQPISVAAKLAYDEKRLTTATADARCRDAVGCPLL